MFITDKKSKSLPLNLEALETRDCPAFDIYYTNSALLIVGQPSHPYVQAGDGLQLHLLANGSIQVHEVSNGLTVTNYGTYAAPANIHVELRQNTDHDFTFDLGGNTFAGNVILDLGRGNMDVLTPNPFPPHPDTFQNGTIGGDVTVRGGYGGELIDLGSSEGSLGTAALPLHLLGNANLSLSTHATPIGGDFLFLNAGSELDGNLTAIEVDNVQIGELPAGANTGSAVLRGNVEMSVANSGNVGKLSILGEVDGNVAFQGSPVFSQIFSDSVFVGSPVASVQAVVKGNLTASLGSGSGDFDIYANGTVDGNVNFLGAQANNFIGLAGQVQGSDAMTLHNGNNVFQFATTSAVGGDLSLSAGNGSNDLGGGSSGGSFDGTVTGSVRVNLGNGTNTALISNAPSGQLNWMSGNGANALTLGSAATTSAQLWNVFAYFGNNDDQLTLAPTAAVPQTLTGVLDGGGRLTGNTFTEDPNSWVLASPFTLLNFD